mgnify:CR=1 FL=1
MNHFPSFPFIREDKTAKSLSFFCESGIRQVSYDVIRELKGIAKKEKTNVRILLHPSPDSELHSMVILQLSGTYNRPHYHKNKSETHHLIEGSQRIFLFDDKGSVIERCDMSMDSIMVYRFEKGYYHMSVPTSELVIVHESRKGPFVSGGDSIFAEWAPVKEDVEEVKKFTSKLVEPETTL